MKESSMTHTHHHNPAHDAFSRTYVGFWIYIMTDCILFCCLFAAYAVLHNNTFGGPSSKDLFDLPFALAETMALLVSSFTCGLGLLAAHRGEKKKTVAWFIPSFLLGVLFLVMELTEFTNFVQQGYSWERSAFLTSFFSLVGTHGCHITIGLIWMASLMPQIWHQGLNLVTLRRLTCLSLFWHFLDVIWIFIFTIVYLMGAH